MTYKITIRKKALKELEKLPLSVNRKISSEIDSLAEEPHHDRMQKIKRETENFIANQKWRLSDNLFC